MKNARSWEWSNSGHIDSWNVSGLEFGRFGLKLSNDNVSLLLEASIRFAIFLPFQLEPEKYFSCRIIYVL